MTRSWLNPLFQLTLWRTREFIREPEAIFWVFAFPVVLAFALGLAFKNRGPETVRIAIESTQGAESVARLLADAPRIEAMVMEPDEAEDRLRAGRVALTIRPSDEVTFRYDSTRREGNLASLVVGDALQRAEGREDVRVIREQRISEPGARYIDFLIPGLLGMNIMGTGLWGIGFGIVKSRNQRLLKRFLASPMRRSHFMLSFVLARLVFLAAEVTAVLLFGLLVFEVPIRGSIVALAMIVTLGAVGFSGLGLLIASRAKTTEAVSGLMNLVMVPMWIGSGVFFAYSNFPSAMQPFIRALPLTALNDALRAVMLDGAPFLETVGLLGIVVAWGALSFGVALKIFRWD